MAGRHEHQSKEKLKAFSISPSNSLFMKTNVFQKKREEKEMKKELEAKETAKVFEDFVASFEGSGKTTKTFVRGTVINPADQDEVAKSAGTLYQPTSKLLKNLEKNVDEDTTSSVLQKPTKKKVKGVEKKRSMLELFGEELKRMQEERNDRSTSKKSTDPSLLSQPVVEKDVFKMDDFSGLPKGSIDCNDPLTTNLYVGNINPLMTEEMLCQHFGKFGALASVKIMWPRTEEEKSRNKNCGFVAFMRRQDAEKALEAMKGSTIMSYEVQIGWGKSVSLPPKPFYVAPDNEIEGKKFTPDPPSDLPFNAQTLEEPIPQSNLQYNDVPPPNSNAKVDTKKRPQEQSFDECLLNSIVKVVIPLDKEILCVIHRMIEFVIRDGPMFEAMIMNREMGNPKFRFLFDNSSADHIYYRWKLFSILQGDSPETWRVDDFRMFDGGSLWKPPTLKNLRGKVIPPIMEIVKKGKLSSDARDTFESMLRNITMERPKIKEAMIWCITHAESAEEISDCLCESLILTETPFPLKIARLYLVNDILQNSTASNASKYRRIFESKLISVIEHLHTILVGIESRLRAESFKRRVLKCLQAWDQLCVYHFNFVDKLREMFIGKTQEELEKKKAFETVAALISGADEIVPEPDTLPVMPLVDNRPIDFSGGVLSFDNNEDIDGEPLVDPDIDGLPMDDDVDGVPMDTVPTPAHANIVRSRWELIDYGNDGTSSDEENIESNVRQKQIHSYKAADPKQLRDIELKVVELAEALKISGNYTSTEIAERTSKFREKLVLESKFDESNNDENSKSSFAQKKHTNSESDQSSSIIRKHNSPTNKKRLQRRSRSRSPSRRRSKSPHSQRHRSRSPHSNRKDHHRSKSPSHKNRKPRH